MEKRYIPRFLNAEPQILWWDLSEFLKVLFFISFGLIADHPFIFTLLGVIFLKLSGKLTSAKEVGYTKHLAYSWGLYGLKGKVPEAWCKELVR
jgi:type IV conjugative transfer system protein TraL